MPPPKKAGFRAEDYKEAAANIQKDIVNPPAKMPSRAALISKDDDSGKTLMQSAQRQMIGEQKRTMQKNAAKAKIGNRMTQIGDDLKKIQKVNY